MCGLDVQAAYDRILELRIATPQIILNYAAYLQVGLNTVPLPPTFFSSVSNQQAQAGRSYVLRFSVN